MAPSSSSVLVHRAVASSATRSAISGACGVASGRVWAMTKARRSPIAMSTLPVQRSDQREQSPRRIDVEIDLARQPLKNERTRFVMDGASAAVERFDLGRGRVADRRVISLADEKIVLQKRSKARQRKNVRNAARRGGRADLERQPGVKERDAQPIRPVVAAGQRKGAVLDEIINRDGPFVLLIGRAAPDRRLVEGHFDEA